MVCYFRKVNEHKYRTRFYSTPHIETLFQYTRKAKHFTSLDLLEGYHQIPITSSSKKFQLFNTPSGQYQSHTIPQGLKVGSQALARLTQSILSYMLIERVLNFADDLVIFSETAEDHIRDVKETLTRLRKAITLAKT